MNEKAAPVSMFDYDARPVTPQVVLVDRLTSAAAFGETRDKKPMRLVRAQTIGDGLVFLTYELVRNA